MLTAILVGVAYCNGLLHSPQHKQYQCYLLKIYSGYFLCYFAESAQLLEKASLCRQASYFFTFFICTKNLQKVNLSKIYMGPSTSLPKVLYNSSHSSKLLLQSPSASAKMPPVLVPHIKSKYSVICAQVSCIEPLKGNVPN